MKTIEEIVSIIIPVYNAEKYLEDTIKTIENQTYQNYEAIFIDDFSTDSSSQIIQKHINDKIKLINLDKNNGPALARNIGIKLAKGRYICFLDADDLWEKDKLEKQINFMKLNNYCFTYSNFRYINQNNTKISREIKVQKELDYKKSLKDNRILTITAMIDTKYISKELIYMPDIKSEDIATWWNILKKGYKAYAIDESLAYYRRHKNSLTANKVKSAKNRWNLYRKYEKFNIFKSIYYFLHYVFFAIVKRM